MRRRRCARPPPPMPAARRRQRPAARRADCSQGHLRHASAADHSGLQDARGLPQSVRRDRGRAAGGGRRRHARQAELRRVRDGIGQRELRLRAGPQSLGSKPRAGRLLGWIRSGGGSTIGAGRDRHRYRWLDPPARLLHGHHRHQADLRRLLALRHGGVRVEPRPGRSAGARAEDCALLLARWAASIARCHERDRPRRTTAAPRDLAPAPRRAAAARAAHRGAERVLRRGARRRVRERGARRTRRATSASAPRSST